MEQKTASDGGDVDTYNLEVSADTVIQGLKINDRPGERRKVVFSRSLGDGYSEGVLRDVRGIRWDGEAPPQLRPQAFLSEDVGSPAEARREGRRIAEEEDDDGAAAEEVAMEHWESQARSWLQEQIVVEPRFEEETRTVYNIEYVDE